MTRTEMSSAIDRSIDRYLERQRALGRAYRTEEDVLRSLSRSLVSRGLANIDLPAFDQWCASHQGLTANVRRNRQRIVRNWCLYRQREEPSCFVPDPNRFPRSHPHQAPVIVAPDQIARMLVAADAVRPSVDSRLRPNVLRLATVLLYSAGLRRGELIGLQIGDVNPRDAVLRIRQSKFHKSRWVPLSRDAGAELRRYLQQRQRQWGMPAPGDPLLCHGTRRCSGYTGMGLSGGLHELMEAAGVHGWDGRRPRIHDLRHSFAIQCLLRWYRQGADVQSQLPKLAMYMGHVSIASTAYYLRWIPELAQAASDRFEASFGDLVSVEVAR
jgi:integrase/recombinase XerD